MYAFVLLYRIPLFTPIYLRRVAPHTAAVVVRYLSSNGNRTLRAEHRLQILYVSFIFFMYTMCVPFTLLFSVCVCMYARVRVRYLYGKASVFSLWFLNQNSARTVVNSLPNVIKWYSDILMFSPIGMMQHTFVNAHIHTCVDMSMPLQ